MDLLLSPLLVKGGVLADGLLLMLAVLLIPVDQVQAAQRQNSSRLVMPAPTAASVMARSGDSSMIQITDMMTE